MTTEEAVDKALFESEKFLQPSTVNEDVVEDAGEDFGEDISEDIGEDASKDVSEDVGEDTGEDVSEDIGEDICTCQEVPGSENNQKGGHIW